MGQPIDKTTLRKELSKLPSEMGMVKKSEIMQIIEKQKCAYDIKSIIEELKENTHDMEICEEQFDMNKPYFMDVSYKMVKIDDVIEIVKRGLRE